MDLFGFLAGISPWMWIALGVALGAIEMTTMSFFLIWPGLAAIAVGIALWLFPELSGTAQVVLFAGLSVAATLAGRAFIRARGPGHSDRPALNRRSAQLVGRLGAAAEPFRGGEGAVEIDGVRWRAQADPDLRLEPGAEVRVRAVDGMTLIVEPESREG